MNWTGPIGRKNQIQMSCPGQLGLPVSQMSGKRKNICFTSQITLFHSKTKPFKSLSNFGQKLTYIFIGDHWWVSSTPFGVLL
jgi:hypothetical protein